MSVYNMAKFLAHLGRFFMQLGKIEQTIRACGHAASQLFQILPNILIWEHAIRKCQTWIFHKDCSFYITMTKHFELANQNAVWNFGMTNLSGLGQGSFSFLSFAFS